jgi:tetratricopeptide (TPR) repeat protein
MKSTKINTINFRVVYLLIALSMSSSGYGQSLYDFYLSSIRAARDCIASNDYYGAIKWCDDALGFNPRSSEGYFLRSSEAYFLSGLAKTFLKDFKGAQIDYLMATNHNPKNSDAFSKLGLIELQLKQYDNAIEHFNRAIGIKPNLEAATNLLNMFYDVQAQPALMNYYTKAIEKNPKDEIAYSFRGDLKVNLEDYKGALEDYTEAIKINPKANQVYSKRGQLRDKLKDYPGAIEDYTNVIKFDRKDKDAYLNRGIAKHKLQNYTGAIEDFDKLIKIYPKLAFVYYSRGLSKVELNQKESACSDFSKASELGYTEAYVAIKKHCQ